MIEFGVFQRYIITVPYEQNIYIFLYAFRDILQNIHVFVSFLGYFFCYYLKIVAVCVMLRLLTCSIIRRSSPPVERGNWGRGEGVQRSPEGRDFSSFQG